MPDQIYTLASMEPRQASTETHDTCTHPLAKGVWHDYGDRVACTRCGELKPDETQTAPAPAKKTAARRATKEKA